MTCRFHRWAVITLIIVGWACVTSSSVVAAGMRDLGGFGAGERGCEVHGLNNKGQIVGFAFVGPQAIKGFVRDPSGYVTSLYSHIFRQANPSSINSSGQVAGHIITLKAHYHAFLWSKEKGFTDLGTLGGQESFASAINDKGQVVGQAETRQGYTHAFLWSQETGMKDLGTLGGNGSIAEATNNRGDVVGFSDTNPKNEDSDGLDGHGFLWTPEKGMTDLGFYRGHHLTPSAINDHGQIVGEYGLSNANPTLFHAFLWDRGKVTDLGTFGGRRSTANAINNKGQVVGRSENAGGDGHAFLWSAKGE